MWWAWASWSAALLLAFIAAVYHFVLAPFLRDLAWEAIKHEFSLVQHPAVAGKRVVVVVNPVGGAGKARDVARSLVVPILHKSRAVVTLVETPRSCGALELDLVGVDLLVVCAGDGTLHSIINGATGLPRVPIAVVPCGSSNGLATSLGSGSVRLALHSLMKGSAKKCDVLQAEFTDAKTGLKAARKELQICGFGLVADHDVIQEETLRDLHFGPTLRGIIAPLIVMIRANWARWRLSFRSSAAVQSAMAQHGAASALPSEGKDGWLTQDVEANCIVVGGSTFGDSSGRMLPMERLNDGAWSVLLFLRSGTWGLIRTFLSIHTGGNHLKRPNIRRWPFEELTLRPLDEQSFTMTMSGERVAVDGEVRFRVLKDAVQFWYDEAKK